MPLVDSEVLPNPLDIPGVEDLTCRARLQGKIVPDQVPSGVFLDTRAPWEGNVVSFGVKIRGECWIATYGVDFPAPR